MEKKEILKRCDHTLLTQTATWMDIRNLCEDAIKYGTATVCIPPTYVAKVKDTYGKKLKVCTVIGFPNGYSTTEVKVFETIMAIQDGADEIDMVVNLGDVRDCNFTRIIYEIKRIKSVCKDRPLKVIVETCLLTETEKSQMCDVVAKSGADYIKTSTGFSTGGATFKDVELFRKRLPDSVKIKAAGGISSLEDAERFIELGADRLGTSRVVKLVKKDGGV